MGLDQAPTKTGTTLPPAAMVKPPLLQPTFPITAWFVGFLAIVLLGLALGGLVTAGSPPTPAAPAGVAASSGAAATAGAAVVLAIVTAGAVAIERILEAFWNFVDSKVGSWWPFSLVHNLIDDRVSNFGALIKPYMDRLSSAQQALSLAKSGDAQWKPKSQQILTDLEALGNQLSTLAGNVQAAPLGNDQKLRYLLTEASSQANGLFARFPELKDQVGKDVDLAATLTDDLTSFTATFSDNPARRIISLTAGMVLGYGVALLLRLDLFNALGVASLGPFPMLGFSWGLGVPLTGLIMGLGSNPTHEVISAIQQFKQNSAQSVSSNSALV